MNWAWQVSKILGGQRYKPTIPHAERMEPPKRNRNVWPERVSLPPRERIIHLFVQ